MIDTVRGRLAKSQAELVRALVAQGPIPAGFDELRVRAAARSLMHKRRQALARVWPALARILGDSYVESFTSYAQSQPLPGCPSPLADGRAFLRWLDARAPLGEAAREEALSFDLHFTLMPRGLRRRRGFALKLARRKETGGLLIGLRIPWFGEYLWRIPRK